MPKQEPIEEAICLCDDMEDGIHSLDCDFYKEEKPIDIDNYVFCKKCETNPCECKPIELEGILADFRKEANNLLNHANNEEIVITKKEMRELFDVCEKELQSTYLLGLKAGREEVIEYCVQQRDIADKEFVRKNKDDDYSQGYYIAMNSVIKHLEDTPTDQEKG